MVHLTPANGFPLGCYQPIIDALLDRFRVVAVPPRALWPDRSPPPAVPGRWIDLARDMVTGLTERGIDRAIAIGHSFGGVASLLAANLPDSPIRALVLLDPTLLEPEVFAKMEEGRRAGRLGWHPLVARTRARRDRFSSPPEAFEYFRGRPAFGDWPDASIERMVADGLTKDGSQWRLSWTPAWEAFYYESIDTGGWNAVSALDDAVPALVLGGASSDTFTPRCRAIFAERAPQATIATVPGGHLFPQSAPAATAAAIREWLDRYIKEKW